MNDMELGAARLLALQNSHGNAARQTFVDCLADAMSYRGVRPSEVMVLFACGICTQDEFDAGVAEAIKISGATVTKKESN